jgi:long-chain fatty acid transport protein
MRGSRVGLLSVVCGLTLLGTQLWGTDAVEPIGWGAKARLRGGADVAIGDSPSAMNLNPASLGFMTEMELDSSFEFLMPSIRWSNYSNHDRSDYTFTALPDMALSIPVNEQITLGVGAFAQAGLGTDWHLKHSMFPGVKMKDESEFKILRAVLAAGLKLDDRTSLGLGLGLNASTLMLRQVVGPAYVSIDDCTGMGFNFTVGVMHKLTDTVTLGLSYMSPTWFGDLEGDDADLTLSPLVGGGQFDYDRAKFEDFKFPQKIAIGAAWQATKQLLLSVEVRYVDYHNSSFDHMTVRMSHGDFGAPTTEVPLNLRHESQFIYIVGGEYRIDDNWVCSLGWNFMPTVTDSRHNIPVVSDIPEHHVTIGVRYEQEKWYLALGYIHAFDNRVKTTMSSIDGGIDTYGSSHGHYQNSVVLGFGYKF